MTQFIKGQSGNPGGRPREIADIRELAREHTPAAIRTLVEIMEDKGSPPAARVQASTALLDRGYGRPAQSVAMAVKVVDAGIDDKELARRIAFLLYRGRVQEEREREAETLPVLTIDHPAADLPPSLQLHGVANSQSIALSND